MSRFRWVPPAAGLWTFTAADAAGGRAEHWTTVRPPGKIATGEASGLPPDEGLMSLLAARSGGTILTGLPPPAWTDRPDAAAKLVNEHRTRVWDRNGIFLFLMLAYLTELTLRRAFKLL